MSSLAFILIGCSFSAIIGTIVGSITGLMPGLHPNSLASFFVAFPQMFAFFLLLSTPFSSITISSQILFGCFLVGVLLSHSITEMIPTSTMGIADDDSIAVLLPVQKLHAMGRTDLIVECVLIGSIGALMIFTMTFLPVRLLMGSPIDLYDSLEPYLGVFLLAICLSVIISESRPRRILKAGLLFLLSGAFGVFIITLDAPCQINSILFGERWSPDPSIFFLPAFAGFFALPSLVLFRKEVSDKFGLPCDAIPVYSKSKAIFRSMVPMLLVGWIPGITNSYATCLSRKEAGQKSTSLSSICSYVVTYSATNIGGSLQAIIALSTILRARNGILESIKDELSLEQLLWADPTEMPMAIISLVWASAISIVVASFLFRLLSQRMLQAKERSYFRNFRIPILTFIFLLSALTSGPIGLVVMFTSFSIAVIALKMNVQRVHLIGFLLLPVIIYFLFQRAG